MQMSDLPIIYNQDLNNLPSDFPGEVLLDIGNPFAREEILKRLI